MATSAQRAAHIGSPAGVVDRRSFLRYSALAGGGLLAGGLLSACGGNGGEQGATAGEPAPGSAGAAGPLRIGVMVPLSGVYAALGETQRDGVQLYLDEHGGQLAGREVELLVEDTEGSPEVGLRKAQRLLQQAEVDFLVGVMNSAVALAVRDLVDQARVPLLVTLANANAITREQRSPFIFRTSFTSWQMSYPMGKWVAEEVSSDGIYASAPDYVAGHEYLGDFVQGVADASGTMVGQQAPPFGSTQDYQPFLAQIRSSDAKVVWAFYGGAEAIAFVKQFAEFGLKDSIELVGHGVMVDEQVLPAIGEAALGIRTQSTYSPMIESDENQAFVDAYRERYDRLPNFIAVHSWDAMQLLDEGLQGLDADVSDVDAVIDALEHTVVRSPRGEFRIDPETHNPVQRFYLREVQEVDGQLVNAVIDDLGEWPDPGAEA